MKSKFFKRVNSWIDLTFLLVNIVTIIEVFDELFTGEDITSIKQHVFEEATKRLRSIEIIGIAVVAIKFTYFLRLVDAMAPIMDIIV